MVPTLRWQFYIGYAVIMEMVYALLTGKRRDVNAF
jgi:hypothetical protein